MAAFAFTIAKFARRNPTRPIPMFSPRCKPLRDLQNPAQRHLLRKTARRSPSRELYAALAAFIAEVKQQQERSNSPAPKDADIFYLLVFLYRMGLLRTNGRPRSRRYIEFLRSQFPEAQELKREESRIIVP